MGDAVADFKSSINEKELSLLYKLVFDSDLVEESAFKFIKDVVASYQNLDEDYKSIQSEDGPVYVSLEDVLMHLDAEKEKRELNAEEKNEFVYCKSVHCLKDLLEKEFENNLSQKECITKLYSVKKYMIDSHPKVAVDLENCYRVAKAYLHDDDRSHCFDVLLAYLDTFWKDKNSFKESPGKDLFDKILAYSKALGIQREIDNRIIDLGIKKGIIKYKSE